MFGAIDINRRRRRSCPWVGSPEFAVDARPRGGPARFGADDQPWAYAISGGCRPSPRFSLGFFQAVGATAATVLSVPGAGLGPATVRVRGCVTDCREMTRCGCNIALSRVKTGRGCSWPNRVLLLTPAAGPPRSVRCPPGPQRLRPRRFRQSRRGRPSPDEGVDDIRVSTVAVPRAGDVLAPSTARHSSVIV